MLVTCLITMTKGCLGLQSEDNPYGGGISAGDGGPL